MVSNQVRPCKSCEVTPDEEDGNGLKLEEIGLAVFSARKDRRTFHLDNFSYFIWCLLLGCQLV